MIYILTPNRNHTLLVFVLLFLFQLPTFSQGRFIKTKEGRVILNRKSLIDNCLESFHKDRNDKLALSICECKVEKLDRSFTNKQYKKYTKDGIIDLTGLMKEDTLIEKQINECYTSSGKTVLLSAEGFENEFVTKCIEGIWKNTEKSLDSNKVASFCACQLGMIKEKKISDAEMETLSNPNSLLFYEMIYKCGNPFSVYKDERFNWSKDLAVNINGPETDTIKVIIIDGMTYLKIKIGNSIQIWLFDTGASDLLIDTNTESQLKTEGIMNEGNYLGTQEYEMANGTIDTCRKYVINGVRLGNYTVNNVGVAVTDKGKRVIVGRTLLNKFSKWILDNERNLLVLHK